GSKADGMPAAAQVRAAHAVVAAPRVDQCRPQLACGDDVSARPAEKRCATLLTASLGQPIRARTAGQEVRASRPDQDVVARPALESVGAAAAIDAIVTKPAGHPLWVVEADHPIVAGAEVDRESPVSAMGGRAGARQLVIAVAKVDRHIGGGRRVLALDEIPQASIWRAATGAGRHRVAVD